MTHETKISRIGAIIVAQDLLFLTKKEKAAVDQKVGKFNFKQRVNAVWRCVNKSPDATTAIKRLQRDWYRDGDPAQLAETLDGSITALSGVLEVTPTASIYLIVGKELSKLNDQNLKIEPCHSFASTDESGDDNYNYEDKGDDDDDDDDDEGWDDDDEEVDVW